jgi:tetratricopeptide (TPR) repeat protein
MNTASCDRFERDGVAGWSRDAPTDSHELTCEECRRARTRYERIAEAFVQLPTIEPPIGWYERLLLRTVCVPNIAASAAGSERSNQAPGWYERALQLKSQDRVLPVAGPEAAAAARRQHRRGRSLDQLGEAHRNAERFDDAIAWYKRAVEAKQKGNALGCVDHESLGRSLHNVGDCYENLGQFSDALAWYIRAIRAKLRGDVRGQLDSESLGRSLRQALNNRVALRRARLDPAARNAAS